MNRLLYLFILIISQLVLSAQAGWAVGSPLPLQPADEDETTYTLTLNTSPANAGSFNRSSGGKFSAGQNVYMYYYTNEDYWFEYWQSGDTVVSRDRFFYFTMPDHDATLTAVFRYSPGNPGDPQSPDQTRKYTLTLNTEPANAGSFNYGNGGQYNVGENLSLYAYNNEGFVFDRWQQGDSILGSNRRLYYTMPASDAALTAVYHYDPASPADPDTPKVYYNVILETQPANAGSFSWNGNTKAVANSPYYVYAYPNSDYTFREWVLDGEIVGTDRQYNFTMPSKDIRLVALYDYTPANPGNPGKNYWNEETGEVIVDDFTAGSLSNAVYNTVGGNSDKVQMMTVAGPVSQYDWGVVNNYSNCTLLDMSRTYGMTYVPSWNFYGNSVLTNIVLPAGIEKIDYYAFRNCSSLSSISIYASTPPTIGTRAFEGIADSIVYVPADAMSLYQEAEGWKDFTILPLAKEVSALEVNLPEGTDAGIYKDMFIELVNTKSGQRQRYVITNRLTYTFNSLPHRTSYNVYLMNASGNILGEVDAIEVDKQDVSVTFPELKVPRTLTLSVLDASGQDVTEQTVVTWFDAKGNWLAKGSALDGQIEGENVKFHVALPQTLAMLYQMPADSVYEVKADNAISVSLNAIPQLTIGGKVIDVKTGKALGGATIAISQTLNGIYSKTFAAKTNNAGEWQQTVYAAKSEITASMTDYVSRSASFDSLTAEIPAFELKDINGTAIKLNLTYTSVDGETQSFYSDYANVAYTVFNNTTNQEVTDINVQYPQIVLMESLPAGTELAVTATSKNQKFMPVTASGTVDTLDCASVTLPIVQLGGISAKFTQTDNNSIVGILYNGDDRLIQKYDYSGTSLSISELSDGDYTLVTMANSQFFNSVATLGQFTESGLREGVDYVKNKVKVQSGAYTEVNNSLIPYLDETKLYYTGDNTSVTVNKTQITVGNYLTLSSRIDFKGTYANVVSDVKLIVDLPEETSFVENSVMAGSSTASYTYENHKLTIPLTNYSDRTRFCFIPTAGGDYTATASVQFSMGGKVITQPVGNVNFSAKDLSVSVPSIVAKTAIPVSGIAVGKSTVEVYVDGNAVAKTAAYANGSWSAKVELVTPQNLSSHNVFAKLTTPAGVEMLSETKSVIYDRNMIQPNSVIMSFYNGWLRKTVSVNFDFQNGKTDVSDYMFYTGTDVTFVADLTNNSPDVIKGVTINVFTNRNETHRLNAAYDSKTDRWVAVQRFESNNLPINLSVNIDAEVDAEIDDTADTTYTAAHQETVKSIDQISSQMETTLNELDTELDKAVPDADRVMELIRIYRVHYQEIIVDYAPRGKEPEYTYNGDEDDFVKNLNGAKDEEERNTIVSNLPGINEEQYNKTLSDYTPNYHQTIPSQTVNGVTIPAVTIDFNGAPSNPEPGEFYSPSGVWKVDEGYSDPSGKSVCLVNGNDKITFEFGSVVTSYPETTQEARDLGSKLNDLAQAYLDQWNIAKANTLGLDVLDVAYDVEREGLRVTEAMLKTAKNADGTINSANLKALLARSRANHPRVVQISKIKTGLRYGSAALGGIAAVVDGYDTWKACRSWDDIIALINELCQQDAASSIVAKSEEYKSWIKRRKITKTVGGIATTVVGFLASGSSVITGGTSLLITAGCGGIGVGLSYWETQYNRTDQNHRSEIRRMVNNNENCKPLPDDDDIPEPPFTPVTPIHDPSGYVYEAVSSNRVQGVTATVYYKEIVEDMYGDLHENIVLWDAEQYAQENPLFTDEYGMYQWDVPQGLWRVKFEKEGYQTTYSEWLPVPPPQLDVNIAMTQMLQPTVKSGKAYSEGVEMEFDKYMDPATLTTDNIMVTKNGNAVSGTVELLNEEVSYEGQEETFASKVRFTVPEGEELLATDEVQLTVKKAVKSYAGVQMQDDYTQKFDVEPVIRAISADSLINVGYGYDRTIMLAALPVDASKGKTIRVQSLSPMIATVSSETLTLDENGQTELKISGELPGSTSLSYSFDDSDVTGMTMVNVRDAEKLVTIAPKASRVSGTEVYRGTKVQLSSETDGAVIYYTLDGSCPCDSETAIKYDSDAPIVINDDNVTIKAIARGVDLAESDVTEFNYSLRTTTVGYTLPEGWTWISHNEEEAIPATAFQTGAERIVSQTQELINDPVAGFIGNLTELEPAVGYKVKQSAENTVRLSGYEWNASQQAVPVESGWNWIGYPVNQTMTIEEALAFFTPAEGDFIVGQNGYAEYADGEWKGTLEGMKPGEGFLYKSAKAAEIVFNTTIVSTANSRLYKRLMLKNSPWAANSRAYSNIMPMTAQLTENGVSVTDSEYVVGAFAGTECRGIGQWKEGRLLMSIYGTGGEDLNFVVYDPQTDQMFNIDETLKFEADNQGTWHQPYSLTLGGPATDLSQNRLDNSIRVTPVVARDHITVTAGGKEISYFSLTDMSGRTVTALSNLGTGATVTTSSLAEGIYILTVKAEGETFYFKIVKSDK